MAVKGGRIPPDGRPSQAKGVGRDAKRHDLEQPGTPGLHGSDLQMGDVQAMEQGQRTAPIRTQERGRAPAPQGGGGAPRQGGSGGMQIPDPIDFLAQRNGAEFNMPQAGRPVENSKAMTWLPILRHLATGPGASSALVAAFVDQARRMRMGGGQPAVFVDMQAADDGIEAMLNAGIRPTGAV